MSEQPEDGGGRGIVGALAAVAAVLTGLAGLLAVVLNRGDDEDGARVEVVVVTPTSAVETVATTEVIVIRSDPADGSTDVAPGPTEIVIEFSASVRTDSWSFVEVGGARAPEVIGDPVFRDQRTVVLAVLLEPATDYAIGINDENHTGFRAAEHSDVIVTPYVLRFRTAGASASA